MNQYLLGRPWVNIAYDLDKAVTRNDYPKGMALLAELPRPSEQDLYSGDHRQTLLNTAAVIEAVRVCQAPFCVAVKPTLWTPGPTLSDRARLGLERGADPLRIVLAASEDYETERIPKAMEAIRSMSQSHIGRKKSLSSEIALRGEELVRARDEMLRYLMPEFGKGEVPFPPSDYKDPYAAFMFVFEQGLFGPLDVKPYLLDITWGLFASADTQATVQEIIGAQTTPPLDSEMLLGYAAPALLELHRSVWNLQTNRYDITCFSLVGEIGGRNLRVLPETWNRVVSGSTTPLHQLVAQSGPLVHGCPAMVAGAGRELSASWSSMFSEASFVQYAVKFWKECLLDKQQELSVRDDVDLGPFNGSL